MTNAPVSTATRRRLAVLQPSGDCLSCAHGRVRIVKEQLKITCARRRRSGIDCPEYVDDGRSEVLHAIVRRLRKTQTGYRRVFNVVQPDCPNCKENCCTRPFLKKTPFYGEDGIYYLLIGQTLPSIPQGVDHCIFFNQGCTLPSHLRPHVCIEYKCPFVPQPKQIDVLGDRMQEDTIYLLSVATQEYSEWRGVYPEKDPSGRETGRTVDRFQQVWDTKRPLEDIRDRYGLQ